MGPDHGGIPSSAGEPRRSNCRTSGAAHAEDAITLATYLLAWNPRRWDWEAIDDHVQELERKGATVRRWSCANSRRIREGDRLFLIRQGEEPRGIFASGVADSNWYEDLHWDEAGVLNEFRDCLGVVVVTLS